MPDFTAVQNNVILEETPLRAGISGLSFLIAMTYGSLLGRPATFDEILSLPKSAIETK